MKKFKYHITIIIKTWTDPDDRDRGLDVETRYDFALTREEAENVIHDAVSNVSGVVQAFGFYQKIEMVEQILHNP